MGWAIAWLEKKIVPIESKIAKIEFNLTSAEVQIKALS